MATRTINEAAVRVPGTVPPGLTAGLAALASSADGLSIPEAALELAHRAIVDTVGVLLAGRVEAPVGLLGAVFAEGDGARSLATGCCLSGRDAALIDGLAAHALDYDDVGQHGHPSVVIVPALLAEAQRCEISGEALVRACAIAQECWAELARRERGALHMGSWHPTSMLGIVAATAGLCALHGLDEPCARNALGLAASFASGLIASFGTHAKPLQAGRAAAGAVDAVRLATAGLTAAPEALESPHGLLSGLAGKGNADTEGTVDALSGRWHFPAQGLSVKRYPVCYAAHRSIDAVLDLRAQYGLRPEDVARVTATMGEAPAATLRHSHPLTGAEARFSLHHNVAAALVEGEVGFAQLDDGFVQRADVAALYDLTQIEVGGKPCPDQPGMAEHDRVRIALRDGRVLDSGPVRYPRGHARAALSDAQLDAKFLDCARRGGVRDAEAALALLRGLRQAPGATDWIGTW